MGKQAMKGEPPTMPDKTVDHELCRGSSSEKSNKSEVERALLSATLTTTTTYSSP